MRGVYRETGASRSLFISNPLQSHSSSTLLQDRDTACSTLYDLKTHIDYPRLRGKWGQQCARSSKALVVGHSLAQCPRCCAKRKGSSYCTPKKKPPFRMASGGSTPKADERSSTSYENRTRNDTNANTGANGPSRILFYRFGHA